ncbi:MAG: hypothetical protein PHY93_17225 [Bacteriovorax sp.]|nr:hypothetical protein [Bacteriovorax sp.]
MLLQKKLTIGFLAFLLVAGCSHEKKVSQSEAKSYEEAKSRVTTETTASEAGAKNYVEIKFNEGSSNLSDSAKDSLRSVLSEARREGKVDEVIVLSWADENYPSKEVKKLSKEQRDLANQRNKNIKEYLKMMRDVDVNSYNMAERPSAFSKLFNTADSELKSSMIEAGLSTTADKADYTSKASHSVILIKTKQ